MNNCLLKLFIVLFVFGGASCSTGPSNGVATGTANVETGAVDVAVDRTFTVTFSAPVDISTVTTSSFFVVPDTRSPRSTVHSLQRADFDDTICDASLAVDATVECASTTECVLTPTGELDPETEYAICVTSFVQFANEDSDGTFAGFTETFTTAAVEPEDPEDPADPVSPADTTAPTVAITSAESTLTAQSPFSITITFSEAVEGFELTDISVTNGTASNLQSTTANTVYLVSITPSDDLVDVAVSLAAGVAADAAGNASVASNTFAVRYDTSALTVALTSNVANPTHATPFSITMTFSEEVSGFALSDLSVTNGTASNFVSTANPVFTADITPTADGTVAIALPASAAVDALTGAKSNQAAISFMRTYDGMAPSVSSVTPANAAADVVIGTTASVTFNEAMTTESMTTNTADTTCSGSLQVSSDSFATCVRMTAAPVASNGDKTFTITPSANLGYSTTYKIRILTAVYDSAGNHLANTYTTAAGFTTEPPPPLFLFENGSSLAAKTIGSRATAKARCEAKYAATYSALGCTNIDALLCYSGGDDVADLLDNHGFWDSVVQGPTGTQVGDNWADLLDGNTDVSLQAAGVTALVSVHVGCNDNGTLDADGNCDDWAGNVSGGAYTQANFNSFGLNSGWGLNCDNDTRYLCVCQ